VCELSVSCKHFASYLPPFPAGNHVAHTQIGPRGVWAILHYVYAAFGNFLGGQTENWKLQTFRRLYSANHVCISVCECASVRVYECFTCLLMQYSSDCRHFLSPTWLPCPSSWSFSLPSHRISVCLQLLQLSHEWAACEEGECLSHSEQCAFATACASASSCRKFRPATSAPFLYGAISVALSRFALKCIIFAGCLLQQQQVLPRPSFWPLSLHPRPKTS